ncbi:Translation initiation factor IF2/IF5 [Corchorus capsularis]|uniref:Translation initiation factor IF2/IF5 n=1 Tax=Corchorus capsularis TaxID=210143 RepID=A0A1R3I736_COCAP|nr:Translation initiation factor IF2/IF5 [Corchorus capsularis]
MAFVNVDPENRDDPFYRYKMPQMQTKIEGRGNGIKTNIVNMVDIAKGLARPASYTTKHFGFELGAQSEFDEKTGTCRVNGSHGTAKLAGLLDKFIKKYVLCYECRNPETKMLINKNQMIQLKCAACGSVSYVDMTDKLTTFILKNLPKQNKGSEDVKQRKLNKQEKKQGSSSKEGISKASSTKKKASGCHSQVDEKEEVEVDDNDDDDVHFQTDTSPEAARQRMQDQLSAATANMVMLSTNESEKKEKVINMVSNKSNGNSNHHQTLVEELKANLNNGISARQLKSLMGTHSHEKISALLEALFDGIEKGFAKEVVKKKNYLAAILTQEKGSQLLLLESIESFFEKVSSTALKEIALVLNALYDADLLMEEYILQWYQEGLKGVNKDSRIWKKAEPFIEWLQSAESESEEE